MGSGRMTKESGCREQMIAYIQMVIGMKALNESLDKALNFMNTLGNAS